MFIAHLALFFAALFAIISALFFLKKQSPLGNRLMGLTMAILSFQHFMHFMWATKRVYAYTWLLNIDIPLDGCIPPLVYFYIRVMTEADFRFKPIHLLHFWPIALGAGWYTYFNLQPEAFKIEFINRAYVEVPAIAGIVNILVAVYLALGYKKINRYLQTQESTEWASGYSNIIWLRQLVVILFFINVGAAPLNLIAKFSYIIAGFPALTGFVVLFIVYKTFNHPEVMSTEIIRKYTQQLEYQRELEKVRGQISKDIHDELGAGLTQITMVSELAKLKQKQLQPPDEQLNKISSLSQELMGSLREVVWAINPVHDNLSSLMAFFRQYVTTFFEARDTRVTIDFTECEHQISVDPYTRRSLILILKEACNNAAKHSQASAVSVSCVVKNNQLVLTIADNGVGLKPGENQLGNGLRNMQKRAAEIKGAVIIESGEKEGTMVKLTCPLSAIT